jgi:pimeloyl-ACP methyl ester carboxylesterase
MGSGPGRTLVMLHASPASAAMLEPLQRELAASRPTISFDTLGNGESDKPRLDWPDAEDYARVVGEALDALGLDEIDLYGTHTGGMIAMELAVQQPERVHRLVLEGAILYDEPYMQNLLANYCPPLEPRWDGGHLLWAWNFLKEQALFWPWFDKTTAGVREVEATSTSGLHRWFLEVLKSGHTYPRGYRAAFAYPQRDRLAQLTTRTLVGGTPDDPLSVFSEEAAGLARDADWTLFPERPADQAATVARFLDG